MTGRPAAACAVRGSRTSARASWLKRLQPRLVSQLPLQGLLFYSTFSLFGKTPPGEQGGVNKKPTHLVLLGFTEFVFVHSSSRVSHVPPFWSTERSGAQGNTSGFLFDHFPKSALKKTKIQEIYWTPISNSFESSLGGTQVQALKRTTQVKTHYANTVL